MPAGIVAMAEYKITVLDVCTLEIFARYTSDRVPNVGDVVDGAPVTGRVSNMARDVFCVYVNPRSNPTTPPPR
jgi:hypothetical protein